MTVDCFSQKSEHVTTTIAYINVVLSDGLYFLLF